MRKDAAVWGILCYIKLGLFQLPKCRVEGFSLAPERGFRSTTNPSGTRALS
jgi:hypothetical protein